MCVKATRLSDLAYAVLEEVAPSSHKSPWKLYEQDFKIMYQHFRYLTSVADCTLCVFTTRLKVGIVVGIGNSKCITTDIGRVTV